MRASALEERPLERPHLATLVDAMRRWGGNAVAVVEHRGIRRRVTSYGALADMAHRFAAELVRREIVQGDRVVVWGGNSAEWIAAFFGCVLRGVLPVPLDAAGSVAFAERIVEEVRPQLVVGDGSLLAALNGQERNSPAFSRQVPGMAFEAFAQLLPPEDTLLAQPVLTPDSPLQILFTSGTTGEPKGVVQTHRNLLASLGPIERELMKYRRYERFVHPLRFLHTLPLSHVFGQFMGLWLPPLLGATVIYESRIRAMALLDLLPRERVHVLCAVPRTLALLRAHMLAADPALGGALIAAQGLPVAKRWWRFRGLHRALGLRFWAAVCGGATLPAEVEQFWTTLGVALIQGYGLTETAALVTLNHPFHAARGSIGKPLPGRSLRLSATGELEVRGEMVATASWQRGGIVIAAPDANEGWLATGDLAAFEPDGRVRFLGRTGQRIVTAAGLNVYLQDVEQALEQQSGLREAMVFGYAEHGGAEQVAAVVVARGEEDIARTAVAAANRLLAPHQQILRWWLWPALALPRTATGKVQRRAVESWALQQARPTPNHAPAAADDTAIALLRAAGATAGTRGDDAARLDADWGLDSMGKVALAAALQEQGIFFYLDQSVQQLETLGDLRALLRAPLLPTTARTMPGDAVSHTGQGERSGSAPSALPEQNNGQSLPPPGRAHADRNAYPEWPWSAPAAIARFLFRELLLRPMVVLLAAPRIARQHMPEPGTYPMLLICNHRTAMDVPLLLYALPYRLRRRVAVAMSGEMLAGWRHSWSRRVLPPALAAYRRWWGPPAAFLLTLLFNVFPLPRTSGVERSFVHAGRALDRGYHVLLFPEGRRAAAGGMLPFKGGLGILALQAHAAVLPLALRISAAAQRHWLRSAPVILVGDPVQPLAGNDPAKTTQLLSNAVASLLESPDPGDG